VPRREKGESSLNNVVFYVGDILSEERIYLSIGTSLHIYLNWESVDKQIYVLI
jgi:hypothetical protein